PQVHLATVGAAVVRHVVRAVPGLDPDAGLVGVDLAVAVGTDASAGAVADVLRARHGAGHAGGVEDALAAHAAVEEGLLGDVLQRRDHALDALDTDAAQEGAGDPERAIGGAVDDLQ